MQNRLEFACVDCGESTKIVGGRKRLGQGHRLDGAYLRYRDCLSCGAKFVTADEGDGEVFSHYRQGKQTMLPEQRVIFEKLRSVVASVREGPREDLIELHQRVWPKVCAYFGEGG